MFKTNIFFFKLPILVLWFIRFWWKKELKHNILTFLGTIGHVDHGKTTLTAAITKGKTKNALKIYTQFTLNTG